MRTLDDIPQIAMDCYQAAEFLGVPVAKAIEMMEAAGWIPLDYNDYGELEYSPPHLVREVESE